MIARADSTLVAALHPAANTKSRRGKPIDILLLHYTGMVSCERAIHWLSVPESRVSCHYVVDLDGRITQMVEESMRAWHAGAGSWAGELDVNSRSIGIEIHNPGHELGYPEFPDAQMRAVVALCQDIVARCQIAAHRVLAHSDTAPERKIDPGEKFDWARLARAGVGHWVPPAVLIDEAPTAGPLEEARIREAQTMLARYGYGIAITGAFDSATETVLRAFQRHFRPARVDGRLDASTFDTLHRLLAALPTAALNRQPTA